MSADVPRGARPLRVLHVIPSLGPARGGPSAALPALARELERRGLTVEVCATDDDGTRRLDVPRGRATIWSGVTVRFFPRQTRFYTVSWPLTRWLMGHARDYDVVHIHALFSYPSVAAALAARLRGVPYIVRPLGTLNRYGMTQRRPLLKRASLRLIEGPILRGAAAVQYTSEDECRQARELGVGRPFAIVAPGVDLAEFAHLPAAQEFLDVYPQLRGRRIILFLSRLDPKKGLDLLLPAFAHLLDVYPGAALVVAGDGNRTFVQRLREEVERLGLGSDVTFTGFLEGRRKLAALAAADVFTLPSYSENFGIACVEALAAGLPVVVTDLVAIAQEVERYGAGVVVAAGVESVRAGLQHVLGDQAARARMSAAAVTLTREKFSLQATGERMIALYRWVVDTRKDSEDQSGDVAHAVDLDDARAGGRAQ